MKLPYLGMLIVARDGATLKLSDIMMGTKELEEEGKEVVLLEKGSQGYQVLLKQCMPLPALTPSQLRSLSVLAARGRRRAPA